MTLSWSSELAYCTSSGGKYFGDQPDRSMCTVGLCVATASASSCHGNEGWARMIGIPGKSAATSSMSIGLEYLSLIPPPPGAPARRVEGGERDDHVRVGRGRLGHFLVGHRRLAGRGLRVDREDHAGHSPLPVVGGDLRQRRAPHFLDLEVAV